METLLVLHRRRRRLPSDSDSDSDSSSIDRKTEDALLKAAIDGDLAGFKGIIKSLGVGNADGAAIFSINKDDFGVLHCAARWGHLEVCKYLVEELGGDVNMPAAEGVTPFMASVEKGDVSIVNYFLDHGGDPMKADIRGRTVLHHAVITGCCKVIEFLLSRGVPVDVDFGRGTPLYLAVHCEEDKIVKILLDYHANPSTLVAGVSTPLMVAVLHRSLNCMKLLIEAGADVNGKGSIVSPLVIATLRGGCTDFIQFLLDAGADPNISDDLGRLPIELAAFYDCREEVEMLFPLTSPIPNVPNWSVDGVISNAKAKLSNAKLMVEGRKTMIKSEAGKAFQRKDYVMALALYDSAIKLAPDATLYSDRSLCKAKMGDGAGALLDAQQCRMMRPDWAEACYRLAAAHIVLEDYQQAAEAILEAEELDPETEDFEIEMRKVTEAMTRVSS
ncbi:unnamed protein product [Urochloa decumbens]|uniref:Uncharacterized protein n=1 Tax=Urochloa decumbens TaxID=240449 RepID=A0ABC9DYV9_9POAL